MENILLDLYYVPKMVRIGTLYFKDPYFFGYISDGVFNFYYQNDDMNRVGIAKTRDDIIKLEKEYFEKEIKKKENVIKSLKEILKSYEKHI